MSKHIDYENEQDKRVWWLNKTGGAAKDNLTVRDYFAAKALATDYHALERPESSAIRAYRLADAMMKAREGELPSMVGDISELELTVRAENVLKSEGIYTIQELLGYSKYDLMKLPNCGSQTVREIIGELTRRGLTLRGLR